MYHAFYFPIAFINLTYFFKELFRRTLNRSSFKLHFFLHFLIIFVLLLIYFNWLFLFFRLLSIRFFTLSSNDMILFLLRVYIPNCVWSFFWPILWVMDDMHCHIMPRTPPIYICCLHTFYWFICFTLLHWFIWTCIFIWSAFLNILCFLCQLTQFLFFFNLCC